MQSEKSFSKYAGKAFSQRQDIKLHATQTHYSVSRFKDSNDIFFRTLDRIASCISVFQGKFRH